MKELLKRSLFGLIYVVAVILALQHYSSKSLLLLFFLLVGLKEFSRLVSFHYNTVLLPAILIFFSFFLFGYAPAVPEQTMFVALAFSLIVLFIPLIYFIFGKISMPDIAHVYLAVIYLVVPFSLALWVESKLLLSVFFIIWASDTFAYLTGKYLGKHKLAEKISPKKTIEGFVGGLLGSLLVAFILYRYTDWHVGVNQVELNLIEFLMLALITVIAGTLGDLLESRFKRLAGVKDSGNIIPGHGGILDRLDSFILAIPFVFAYIFIIY